MDKKSQHVGNHGGKYTDEEGMSRQFTYVDHDKKTTISTSVFLGDPKKEIVKYRAELIRRITLIPASLCPTIFHDFSVRGEKEKIEWNIDMLLDAGVPLKQLSDLCSLLENKVEMEGIHAID